MKYVEVAVLTYTKENTQTFSYKIPEKLENEIKSGQLLKVPFKNRQIKAVVLNITEKKPKFKIKDISEIIKKEPILVPHLTQIAKWMSGYYQASLNSVIQTMIPKGVEKKRRNIKQDDKKKFISKEMAKKLTSNQQKILNKIIKDPKKSNTYLIHGITGSGKTEIYLQAIDYILKQGKEVIVLVPEVSLTPQAIQRFEKRFPKKVALLHSYMKETERYHNWQEINQGKKPIVIGSRSALFAPLHNLGIIIIDEEHETSYKQEQTPRYNTQAVAKKITEKTKAKIILGSATPKMESYYKAQKGEYKLFSLPKRIKGLTIPEVKIVDLKEEFKKRNKSIFSEDLQEKIKKVLEKKTKNPKNPGGPASPDASQGGQIILFLNRRGTATFVSCRDCGHVMKCPNCEIPLTYHQTSIKYPWPKQASKLLCHHCGFKQDIPTFCPKCKSVAIKYFGTGTQKVEKEVKKFFPEARILRMDQDTTKKRGAHDDIYNAFANKNYDILIGTQMITKGWDLPNVELVGVISADTALNFPDFRASERTFQLLTQVAGRTGRGKTLGKVIIQTYNPDNFTIQCAADQDYKKFYEEEIKTRKSFSYPPFSNLIKLVYQDENGIKAKNEAEKLYNTIESKTKNIKSQIMILGPSPCFIPKIKGKYRYHILIKLKDIKYVKNILADIPKTWSIDIDPINIL